MTIDLPPPNVPGGNIDPAAIKHRPVEGETYAAPVSKQKVGSKDSITQAEESAQNLVNAYANLFDSTEASKRIQPASADLQAAETHIVGNPWFAPQAAVAFAQAMREFAFSILQMQFQESLNANTFLKLSVQVAKDLSKIEVDAANKRAQAEIIQAGLSFAQAAVSFASAGSLAGSRFKKSATTEIENDISQKKTNLNNAEIKLKTTQDNLNKFKAEEPNIADRPLDAPTMEQQNQIKLQRKIDLEKQMAYAENKRDEAQQDLDVAVSNKEKNINDLTLRRWQEYVQPVMQGMTQSFEAGKSIVGATVGKEADLIAAQRPIFEAFQNAANRMLDRASTERKDFKDAFLQVLDALMQSMKEKAQNKIGFGA